MPTKDLGPIVDSFTRNAVLSSNEVRGVIGYAPSKSSGADDLANKNLNQPTKPPTDPTVGNKTSEGDVPNEN